MSTHKGFSLVWVLPVLMLYLSYLGHYLDKLIFLKTTWLSWQQRQHVQPIGMAIATLMDDNPCVLLCNKHCVTAHLWKMQYENIYFYVLKPLQKNQCHQKNSLKNYHAIVAWH